MSLYPTCIYSPLFTNHISRNLKERRILTFHVWPRNIHKERERASPYIRFSYPTQICSEQTRCSVFLSRPAEEGKLVWLVSPSVVAVWTHFLISHLWCSARRWDGKHYLGEWKKILGFLSEPWWKVWDVVLLAHKHPNTHAHTHPCLCNGCIIQQGGGVGRSSRLVNRAVSHHQLSTPRTNCWKNKQTHATRRGTWMRHSLHTWETSLTVL